MTRPHHKSRAAPDGAIQDHAPPVSGLLLGIIVPGEPVVARQFAGMALIGAVLVAVDGCLWRTLNRRSSGAGRRLAQTAK